MFRKRALAGTAGLLMLAAWVGCSRSSGRFATVSGTITHNGAPVDNAKVTFYSTTRVEGQGGTVCSVQTDSSGKYLLVTAGKDPGIPPGMYKVTIVKLNVKANLPPEFDAGQMAASGMGRNAMPKDYENPNTTKLSVTLEEGKNENKNFELKGQASGGMPEKTP